LAATDTIDSIDHTDAARLAGLMDIEPDQREWGSDEKAAIWRHQMSAPMGVDLGNLGAAAAPKLKSLCLSEGLLISSFRELIQHPNPPVELLIVVKDFAKLMRKHPHSPLPPDVSVALYYACVAAALVTSDERLAGVSEAELLRGLEWLASLDWVDQDVRALAQAARAGLPGTSREQSGES